MYGRRAKNAESEWRAAAIKRTRDLEATATDLQQLTVDDSGVHRQLDRILRQQADFSKQTLGIFQAYDQEMRERDEKLARLWDRVQLLLWVDGVTFVVVVGVLAKMAFRGV